MRLKEYEGKAIFAKVGIRIPKGVLVKNPQGYSNLPCNELVLKSQILAGSRKKNGGIIFTTKKDVEKELQMLFAKKINGLKVKEVLIEEKLPISKELYLGLTVDRAERCIKLIFSETGGIDIEKFAQDNPKKVIKKKIEKEDDINIPIASSIAKKLFRIMKEKDATLVEINPLVLSKKRLIAADSKIIIDDNSLFRQQGISKEKKDSAENRASQCGFNYIELEGDIAVIGNGAGLVMATLDIIGYYGGKAAAFLDIGGGADFIRMENAIDFLLEKKPKGLLINIFGGITRCDEIAKGIINYKKKKELKLPFVVRLTGTNQEEGRKILNHNQIYSFGNMEECIKKILEMCKNGNLD